MRARVAFPVLVVLATLVLASCSSATTSPTPSPGTPGRLLGIALAPPGGAQVISKESPLPDGFGPNSLVPDEGAPILVKALSGEYGGRVVARLTADADGLFDVSLAPGTYLVLGRHEPQFGKAVTIRSAAVTRVMVEADIRF